MKIFTTGKIIATLVLPLSLNAATRTWTGGTGNTKWDHPNNWNCLCTPSTGDNIIVNNAGSSQPTITIDDAGTFNPANVTINSGATLTFESGNLKMSGNWINNGTFTGVGGSVEMTGSSEQAIQGASTTSFYGLTVNNTSGIRTSLNVNVKSSLIMVRGNISLAGFTITLGTSGLSTGTLTRTSGTVIGGKFRRWFGLSSFSVGDTRGLFPVGHTSDYRPFYAAPSVLPTIAGTITVEHVVIYGTKDVNFMDGADPVVRRHNSYWAVTTGDGLTGLLFDLMGAGTGWGVISSVNDLRLTLFYSVVASPGTNGGTASSPEVRRTGLSLLQLTNNFYMASINSVSALPVELLEFTAVKKADHVKISWKTATEINNDYYTIGRSADGVTYTAIARVKGSENSRNIRSYSFEDDNATGGAFYYRLSQTDIDGKTRVYTPVRVNTGDLAFRVYPNPSSGGIITLEGIPAGNPSTITVFDISGKKVIEKPVESGLSSVLELNEPGIYMLRITDEINNNELMQKIVVSR